VNVNAESTGTRPQPDANESVDPTETEEGPAFEEATKVVEQRRGTKRSRLDDEPKVEPDDGR